MDGSPFENIAIITIQYARWLQAKNQETQSSARCWTYICLSPPTLEMPLIRLRVGLLPNIHTESCRTWVKDAGILPRGFHVLADGGPGQDLSAMLNEAVCMMTSV